MYEAHVNVPPNRLHAPLLRHAGSPPVSGVVVWIVMGGPVVVTVTGASVIGGFVGGAAVVDSPAGGAVVPPVGPSVHWPHSEHT